MWKYVLNIDQYFKHYSGIPKRCYRKTTQFCCNIIVGSKVLFYDTILIYCDFLPPSPQSWPLYTMLNTCIAVTILSIGILSPASRHKSILVILQQIQYIDSYNYIYISLLLQACKQYIQHMKQCMYKTHRCPYMAISFHSIHF